MKFWKMTQIVFFLGVTVVSAQENPILLDFKGVLVHAFSEDPGLGARDDAIRIEKSRVREAIGDFFPRLDAYSSYTRSSLESGIEIFNPQTMSSQRIDFFPKDRYDFGLLVTQDIFTFGRRSARRRAAEKGLAMQRVEEQDYRQKLYDSVARAFAAILLHKENMDIQAENLKRAEARLAIVKARIAEGVATDYDLVRAELHLAVYQRDHNRAVGDFRKSRANLRDLIAWDRDYNIVPVGEISDIEAALPDSLFLDSSNRVEIRRLELLYEAQMQEARIHRSAYFPDLSCFGKYDWQNGYQPDIDRVKGAWSTGLTLNWRILDGGGRRQRTLRARFEAEKTEKLLLDMVSRVKAEKEAAEIDLAVAARDLELARRSFDLAEKGLDIAEGQYQQGILGIGDLLDLEIERGDAEKALNVAEYSMVLARLDFKRAIGFYPELP